MKRRSGRFEKIVTLAAAAERNESVALGRARRALDEAVERLGELERYRHEYAAGHRTGDEVSAVRWADFQAFLGRLDEAVKTQRQVIRDGERIVYASLPATKKWLADNKWQTAKPFAI